MNTCLTRLVAEPDSQQFEVDLLTDFGFDVPLSIRLQPNFFDRLAEVAPPNVSVSKPRHSNEDKLLEYNIYQNGNLRRTISYDREGRLCHDHSFYRGRERGKWLDFYCDRSQEAGAPNGANSASSCNQLMPKINIISHYRYGLLHGSKQTYSRGGKALELANYNEGVLDGPYYCWGLYDKRGITSITAIGYSIGGVNITKDTSGKEEVGRQHLLLLHCNYQAGKLIGHYESYWSNGQVKLVCNLRCPVDSLDDDDDDDEEHQQLTAGKSNLFAALGEVEYKQSCFEGRYLSYYPNGDLHKVAFYDQDGRLDGRYAEWILGDGYRTGKDGVMMFDIGHFDHGLKQGRWVSYAAWLGFVYLSEFSEGRKVSSTSHRVTSPNSPLVARYLEARKNTSQLAK